MAPILLTFGPLAVYFIVQGCWCCSSRPRVISGAFDYVLLAVGLGALLAYGPVGDVLLRSLFRSPGVFARLAWLSFLTMMALLLAVPSHRRLILHNISPEGIEAAVQEALRRVPGAFTKTLQGFEDRADGRGIRLRVSRRLGSAEIETYGRAADELAHALIGPLRDRLARDRRRPSWCLALTWFGLALTILGGPIAWTLSNAADAARSASDDAKGRTPTLKG